MRIVAVTACPTGIAHTYMAAAKLEKTAKDLGHEIKVETQGALGIENALSESDIREAKFAIFAVDIGIEGRERFKGVHVIEVPLREAITNTRAIFERAISERPPD
jgi:fructose-specific phosphotransferase system IIB component